MSKSVHDSDDQLEDLHWLPSRDLAQKEDSEFANPGET